MNIRHLPLALLVGFGFAADLIAIEGEPRQQEAPLTAKTLRQILRQELQAV